MSERYRSVIGRSRVIRIDGDGRLGARLGRLPPGERPRKLYAAGEPPACPAVAIVGTRSPDAHGAALARKIARECALRDLAVISGGASGIDRAAHEGCLEAGGKTVVVMAGGLEKPHPPGSSDLFAAVVSGGGCLVTEQAFQVPPRPFLFLRRNRLIASLSDWVIVVQARWRSGAISTATWAGTCGVPLFAVAGSPVNPLHHGTNRMIADGRAGIIISLDALFKELSAGGRGGRRARGAGRKQPCSAFPIDDGERMVAGLVGTEPLSADDISAHCRLSIQEISQILANLEMKGMVTMADPGRYIATSQGMARKT
ncbi:MAG: DNA-processing protein DprA [Pseudomonadota bacterium]